MSELGPVFVALEGLRGAGKSTVAALLAERLSAHHVPSFPAEYMAARQFLDHDSRNADARAYLFASALCITGERIRELLAADTSVVIDSFVQRTIVTHHAYGANVELPRPADFPEPVTFYLECTPATRQHRLQGRAKPTTWWDELAESNAVEIAAAYAQFANYRLDTTFQEPGETAAAIVAALRQRREPKQAIDVLLRVHGSADAQVTD